MENMSGNEDDNDDDDDLYQDIEENFNDINGIQTSDFTKQINDKQLKSQNTITYKLNWNTE